MTTTEELLAEIGGPWRFVRQLQGGYQGGASLVEDGTRQAVFKWSKRTSWAPRVLGAKACVDHARACGYPTPAWLAVGTTADGFPYHVQELVKGATTEETTSEVVAALMAVTERQRGIEFGDDVVDWTDYACMTVFDDPVKHTRLAGSSDEAAAVVQRGTAIAAPFRDAALVHHEMVHGDLSGENMLMLNGVVTGVIDMEAVGRGCSSIDLARVHLWSDPKVSFPLVEEALRRDGPAIVAIATVTHAFDLLTFGLDNWPADHVRGAATGALRWFDAVSSAVG